MLVSEITVFLSSNDTCVLAIVVSSSNLTPLSKLIVLHHAIVPATSVGFVKLFIGGGRSTEGAIEVATDYEICMVSVM